MKNTISIFGIGIYKCVKIGIGGKVKVEVRVFYFQIRNLAPRWGDQVEHTNSQGTNETRTKIFFSIERIAVASFRQVLLFMCKIIETMIAK